MGWLTWALGWAWAGPAADGEVAARCDRAAEDAALRGRYEGLLRAATEQVTALEARLARAAGPDERIGLLIELGGVHQDQARAIREQQAPCYLTDDQGEMYRSALSERAWPLEEASEAAFRAALDLSREVRGPCDRRALVEILAHREDLAVWEHPPHRLVPAVPCEAALAHHLEARAARPDDPWPALHLAWIAVRGADFDGALQLLQGVRGTDADLIRAAALRGSGDPHGARERYDAVLRREPTHRLAAIHAATLQERSFADRSAARWYLEQHLGAVRRPDPDIEARLAQLGDVPAREPPRPFRCGSPRRLDADIVLPPLAARIEGMRARLRAHRGCLEPEVAEEVEMILEQAAVVVEARDVDMASDIEQLLQAYEPVLDEAAAECPRSAPPERR